LEFEKNDLKEFKKSRSLTKKWVSQETEKLEKKKILVE
jgi:hypothetical protein